MEKSPVPLKPPVWTWEVPVYFYVGGAAGAAAVIAGISELAGRDPALAADARWIAAAGALLSPALLISDLGRPSRFLNMLRVFKWRSPMSIGAWTLAAFSGAVFASIMLHAAALPAAPGLAPAADLVAALTGSLLAVYTGVLIGATAIPVWARHVTVLPLHFGASSLGVAVSILELTGHRTPALNGLGIGAAAVETVLGIQLEWSRDRVTRSLFTGSSGVLVRLGAWLTGPVPLVLRLASGSLPALRLAAAVSMTVGSLATRFGWIGAGRESAADRAAALNGDPA
ncbi:MAG TPA: NrfD/PsrC family molybdoenzyme membrane anchor subunit [Vicinamibacterales bacterium]|nr:NrfD/PsrC family molybdoenzyme membrane anchor subunit [Vicinamibacterales bacterium]